MTFWAMTTHRVDGYDRAFDAQEVEQPRDGDDFVGFFADFGLSEHHALARG